MAVDPKAFLAFAEKLDANACELHARTKVNRSYYAAYHYAKDNVDAKVGNGHLKLAETSHEQIVESYVQGPSRAHKSIGYSLRDVKRQRHEADYKLTNTLVTGVDADQVHAKCALILSRIDALPTLNAAVPAAAAETLSEPLPPPRPRLSIVKPGS